MAQLTGGAGAMTVANAVTRNLDSHEHGTALAAHAHIKFAVQYFQTSF